ncbi:MAG: RNA-binding protein YhbY [Syntrophus sp. SKADARSKE-3]|nr:RNA-binding protein YhbY [Syntrophus sp. SKADARSKE-3]
MEKKLTGTQKKYLRGLAHDLKPLIQIGKGGLTDKVIAHIDQIFHDHELIKIKFNEFREEKKEVASEIATRTHCETVGIIGNISIFYREHPDTEKRRVILPTKNKVQPRA